MERQIYEETARTEDHHWWFAGRRKILASFISTLPLPADAQILEAGCGSGGNLPMLSRFGKVSAFEYDDTARAVAVRRNAGEVRQGSLPDGIPFAGKQFDVICLLDVLEHLEQDKGSLQALYSRLKPGGRLLLTVPAYMFLWSIHDVLHHHHRRYTCRQLSSLVRGAGFSVRRCSYFNFWLFPLIAMVRLMEKLLPPRNPAPLQIPPAPLNTLLAVLFASERFLLRWINLPFGVSIILLAQKPET